MAGEAFFREVSTRSVHSRWQVFWKKNCSKKFRNIYMKTLTMGFLFKNVFVTQPKRLWWDGCFPVSSGTAILQIFVEWLPKKLFTVFFFFYLGFLLRTFTNDRTAGQGEGHFFNSSLPLPPASQARRHWPGDCCGELTSAYS